MPLRTADPYPPDTPPPASGCLPPNLSPPLPDAPPPNAGPSPFAIDPDRYGNRNPNLEGFDPPSVEQRARHRHPPPRGSTYAYFEQTPTHRLLWDARAHRLGPWYFRRAQDPNVWWHPFPNYGIHTDDDQYLASLANLNPATLARAEYSQNFVKHFPTTTRNTTATPQVRFHAYMVQVAGYMHANSFFFPPCAYPSSCSSLPLWLPLSTTARTLPSLH